MAQRQTPKVDDWVDVEDWEDVGAATPPPAAAPVAAPAPASQSPEFQMMMGATPTDLFNRFRGAGRAAGKVGMGALQYAQYLGGFKVSPTPLALEPSPDPNEQVGGKVAEAAMTAAPALATSGASLPVQAGVNAAVGGIVGGKTGAVIGGALPVAGETLFQTMRNWPSKARAGAKFQQVMAKAADQPINTKTAQTVADRAVELKQTGASMPKVFNDFTKNRSKAAAEFMTQPVAEPMTYKTGRDFATNAGALSVKETTRLSPQMKSQVSQFAKAMKDANREAAVQVGMGDLYDQAMKEYSQAMDLEAKKEVLKKFATTAVIGYAGLKAVDRLISDLMNP